MADWRILRRWRRELRGYTLLELIVVVCIISVLAATAFDRLLYYTERAEKAAMDATLAATKMGLQIRLAELITANRQMAAVELERENPFRWLMESPPGYAGEYRAPPKEESWYFAEEARQLVYVPRRTSYLQLNHEDIKELRFQARLYYDEIELAGARTRSVTGVRLLPVKPYHWF